MSASRPWAELGPREKEAAVLPLAEMGLSANRIAAKLGLPSRNMVVTVIARLQKSERLGRSAPKPKKDRQKNSSGESRARQKSATNAGSKPEAPLPDEARKGPVETAASISIKTSRKQGGITGGTPGKALREARARRAAHPNDFKARAEDRASDPGITITKAAAFDPIPGIEPVALVDHREGQCRWPVSPAVDDGRFYFCGASCGIGDSYCASHIRLNFQPRQRAAA